MLRLKGTRFNNSIMNENSGLYIYISMLVFCDIIKMPSRNIWRLKILTDHNRCQIMSTDNLIDIYLKGQTTVAPTQLWSKLRGPSESQQLIFQKVIKPNQWKPALNREVMLNTTRKGRNYLRYIIQCWDKFQTKMLVSSWRLLMYILAVTYVFGYCLFLRCKLWQEELCHPF